MGFERINWKILSTATIVKNKTKIAYELYIDYLGKIEFKLYDKISFNNSDYVLIEIVEKRKDIADRDWTRVKIRLDDKIIPVKDVTTR